MKHTSPSHISLAKASHMATSNFSSVMIYNFTAGVNISSYMAKSNVSETGVCKPLSSERRWWTVPSTTGPSTCQKRSPFVSKLHFIWTCIVFLLNIKAAAAAKSLQSCPTLCDPIDGSPPGSAAPGILQARTLEWVAIFLLQCMKVKSESEVVQSCLTLSDPMGCSLPGSSVHGISRQEYWSGLSLPSPIPGTRGHIFYMKLHLLQANNTYFNPFTTLPLWQM